MVVLDTCSLLWWTLQPEQLSAKAARLCEQLPGAPGWVSSISFWEIGIKQRKGQIQLPVSLEEFVARVKRTGAIRIVPVDESIWLKSLALDWKHTDPADRVVVATALKCEAPLLTKDDKMRRWRGVETIW